VDKLLPSEASGLAVRRDEPRTAEHKKTVALSLLAKTVIASCLVWNAHSPTCRPAIVQSEIQMLIGLYEPTNIL
jgi:hypothetical protein